ncbi:MAG TPA: hypothetical protein VND96_18910 [Candidatus Micrarchaeaceae archaeon]|nr:hypothetical protein [Candidatus Micrarchaeaceae archaeon]
MTLSVAHSPPELLRQPLDDRKKIKVVTIDIQRTLDISSHGPFALRMELVVDQLQTALDRRVLY